MDRLNPSLANLHDAEASDRVSRHIAGIVARAIDGVREGQRSAEALRVAASRHRSSLQSLAGTKDDLAADELSDPARVLVALLQRLPDGTPHGSSGRSRRCSTRPSSRTRPASRRSATSSARRSLGRRDRRRDGVHPLERRAAADRRAPAPLRGGKPLRILTTTYTNSTEQRALDELERARRRDQGLVRHDVDPAPREGVALPPRERLLDGVHRLVEPHALGAGARARVERPRLRASQPGRRREDGRRLRELLGERATSSPYDPDEFARRTQAAPARRTSRCSARSRSSCGRSRRRCSSRSSSRATKATTATCSSRRPAPARQ